MKYAAIECQEEHGTKSESIVREGSLKATVTLRCKWDVHLDLMQELLSPDSYPYPNTPAGWTPIWPANCTCVPDETHYTSDNDKQLIYYEDALVTVNYDFIDVSATGVDPENPDIQTRINEQLEPYAEFLKSDPKDFAWGKYDGVIPTELRDRYEVSEEEAPGTIYRGFSLSRQYYNVPSVSATALILPGHVNKQPYTSHLLGWVFPAETLLFNPPSMQRTWTTAGTKGWNLTVKFNYKPQGWNKFWRKSTGKYERMYRWNRAIKNWQMYYPYPLGDFSAWLY